MVTENAYVIKESSILHNRALFRLKKKKHQGGYLGPAGNRTKMLQEKQWTFYTFLWVTLQCLSKLCTVCDYFLQLLIRTISPGSVAKEAPL